MRKIDKQCLLSTAYKTWEENLENTQTPHPKYKSSNAKYYQDVRMQLYYCQDGLCAYTEIRLCDEDIYAKHHWKNGRYKSTNLTKQAQGQLDHFDENLKSKKGDTIGKQDWLWDNFFMIDSEVNTRIKGSKPVDDILKPDSPTYSPFDLLEYDEYHQFLPHRNLDHLTFERVKNMIEVLGLNSIRRKREDYLLTTLNQLFSEDKKWDDFTPKQFPTAFEMYKQNTDSDDFSLDDIL